MTGSNLTFKRKERKYLILEHSFDSIQSELSEHIPIYIFEGDQALSNIETTYLDTANHLLFQEYLARRNFRFKIRLRRYGRCGILEDYYLIELKVKHSGISNKKRFMLPASYLPALLKGENLKAVVKEANKGLVGAQKTYKLISKLIVMNEFIPILRSSYERIAFQKKSKKVRITIDRNIQHNKLLGKSKTASLDAVILESKIMGKTPKWYKKMMNKLSLLRQGRFSKYATGMNSIYYPSRGKYNFENEGFDNKEIPQKIIDSFELMKTYLKLGDVIE